MTDETKDDLRIFREHMLAAFQAWREGCKTLIPEGFYEKTKEGQKEALLALRSLVDRALEKLEAEGTPKTHKKKAKIEPEE